MPVVSYEKIKGEKTSELDGVDIKYFVDEFGSEDLVIKKS